MYVGYTDTKPEYSVLAVPIDLSKTLKEFMYVGFSASNGRGSSIHSIQKLQIHTFESLTSNTQMETLSALLSNIELNIREAHMFSTIDGYSLDVFVVDGWPFQESIALHKAMEKAISRSEGSWSGSCSDSISTVQKALATQEPDFLDPEIDRALLNIGKRIASGSCGDLEVQHTNVRFIGACTKHPPLCIITEYMSGGSLYDYLHNKKHNVLMLPELLKFGIDVCKGMEYLHNNNIIHRDLKTANLLLDSQNVTEYYYKSQVIDDHVREEINDEFWVEREEVEAYPTRFCEEL